MKHWFGNALAILFAIIFGAGTIAASLKYLKEPDGALDWTVLILSGLTTGTIAFFVTWGHFQAEPVPENLKPSDEN